MRYVLDGGCKSNPLLDQDPTDTFNLMCFFMHEIPGSIFTPDLPATLESFLPSSEAEVDPSVVEKVKTEVDQLPAPNYESLKLLAWFFNQLHNVEDAPVGLFLFCDALFLFFPLFFSLPFPLPFPIPIYHSPLFSF